MTAPSIARIVLGMDTSTVQRDALRRVHTMLLDSRATVRLSELRNVVNDAVRVAERALEPTEPTPIELRAALQALVLTPAVRQAVGNSHTAACECAYCVAMGLLR